ncbi:MAG: polyphosphate polymerase domain-containing protein [Bacteroidales bacterium]|nr:polyphosphate polymerase domain-containing protein [Bacteroidales bacterium]
MESITLDEMSGIRLMDRIDMKFVSSISVLPQLLDEMLPYFKVQEVDNQRISSYATQYLDTSGLEMFVMHQNGKLNRQKVRIRSYVDSNLSFLEVKNKNNKGRTRKMRVPVNMTHINSVNDLGDERCFLDENSIFQTSGLKPTLANEFERITLVNDRKTERITIDIHLSFYNYQTKCKEILDNMMILELKQDGWQQSDFRDILNRLRIKQFSFSKYCMGTVLTNPDVKYNRFKGRWTLINKII